MPKSVLLIGVLFILAGITALFEVLADLTRSHINVNFGVLALPIGIGLLRSRAWSLRWARFALGVMVMLALILCGAALLHPERASAEWFGRQLEGSEAAPYAIAVSIGFGLIFFLARRHLGAPHVRAAFGLGAADGASASDPTDAADDRD